MAARVDTSSALGDRTDIHIERIMWTQNLHSEQRWYQEPVTRGLHFE